ncbi:MAG: hypothetical protein ACKV2V_15195 [Blastocatellia bacterium]
MKRAHLLIGIATLIIFALTGQYMDRYHDHLHGMPDLPRMLYRSRHIYLLLAGLLHLGLGLYLRMIPASWRGWAQIAGSALVMLSTGLLLAAFFYEPQHPDLNDTPFSRHGIYLVCAGALLHMISQIPNPRDV